MLNRAVEQLRFSEATQSMIVDERAYGLALTQTGDPALWAPYQALDGSLVAIAGRPAFDDAEWQTGVAVPGSGGLAAKLIYRQYQESDLAALEQLNGNCAVIVYDAPRQIIHLVTDCCGVFPVFETQVSDTPLFGSHPDVLADAAGERSRLDEVSLAEFILSGTVTPPYSYYERVRAADYGTIYTFNVSGRGPKRPAKRRYWAFHYRGQSGVPEWELAQQLAVALRRAIERRTLPRLGPSAVALSGGLDSRVVLACALDRSRALAFTCYDKPNREFRTAEAIARSAAVRFVPLRRGPEYYADHAELGVRISGGMGSFANNHFLGIIPELEAEGVRNLLTGCYCDYVFKGLPLNRWRHPLTRREALAPFCHEFYFNHFSASTKLAQQALDRWESRVPHQLRQQDGAASVFQIETRRTFPLFYEGDNQQRLVPQRVTGWAPPFVDREVMEVYCRLPYFYKLNRSVFRKVVRALAPDLCTIPDTNTGAAPDASPLWEWVRGSQLRTARTLCRLCGLSGSDESWPNWYQYVRRSRKLDALWRRPNPDAIDFFQRVLGPADMLHGVDVLKSERPFLFVGLLSLKLWLDQCA